MSEDDNIGSICSGAELLEARGRDTLLPSLGGKFTEIINPFFIGNQNQMRRNELKNLTGEPIVSRTDIITEGEWFQSSGLVWLKDGRGRIPHHYGVLSDKGPCLYPEEAIFLLHAGELRISSGEVALSIEAATAMLLQHSHWNYVVAYNYLASMGCRVHRHQPHLCTTKYEKKLNLNQDVLTLGRKKKRVSLFPAENSAKHSPAKKRNEGNSVASDHAAIDLELRKFYDSIGENSDKEPPTGDVVVEDATDGKFLPSSRGYQDLKKRALDQFMSMFKKDQIVIDVEDHSLLPENSIPVHSSYTISLRALNYFSKYRELPSQNLRNFERKRKNFDNDCDYHPRKYRANFRNRRESHYDNYYNEDHFYDGSHFQYERESSYFNGHERNFADNYFREDPPWKINWYRKNHMKGVVSFPSYLVKSIVNCSSSWKDYKSALKSATEDTLLRKEPCGILWKGKTVPLIKPSHATNLKSILDRCVLSKGLSLKRSQQCGPRPSDPYFDIYLPGVSYRPSEPPLPSARVFIPKNNEELSQKDILQNLSRYDDEVPCLFVCVIDGIPRMYSVTRMDAQLTS